MKMEVLIDEGTIEKRLDEIADQINKKYEGQEVLVVAILKGSFFCLTELVKRLDKVDVMVEFIQVSSYGDGTVSSGNVQIKKDIGCSIEGRKVILVEDIIDTGITLSKLLPMLRSRNPESLELFSLLSKPSRREAQVDVDYLGFEVEDKFVVGFGMDAAEHYRHLPYIGYVVD